MSTAPREIGTLIVVILKARNLPNKRHIGKQDPFCLVQLNGEKRRTKAIKRGGQHPEWDEEVRFTLYEGDSDTPVQVRQDGAPPPPPPKKATKDATNIQGGKYMAISCYAEDVKEPDFIGETRVDLTEVLTKGETDEWFALMNKDRYSGEVYLELTFWSNEPAPAKKAPVKAKAKRQYGGPGTFVAPPDTRGSSESPNGSPQPNRMSSSYTSSWSSRTSAWASASSERDLRADALPPSLRASSSIAQIGLYRPTYETASTHSSQNSFAHPSTSSISALTDELGQMDLHHGVRRRLSLPQMTHSDLLNRSTSSHGFPQTTSSTFSHALNSSYSDDGATDYNDAGAHASQIQQQTTGNPENLYHAPYEPISRAPSVYSSHSRGPRLSLPTSSSGFMPIPTPTSTIFAQPGQPQMSGYHTPISATPAPSFYRATPAPMAAPTPAPAGYGSLSVPNTTAATSFRPQPTPSPSYASPHSHAPAPSTSVPVLPQQYNSPGSHMPQAMSYQSISQSQSAYSYQPYPMSSSVSNNAVHQYHTGLSISASHTGVAIQHNPQTPAPQQYMQPQVQARPPPLSPTNVPPPPSMMAPLQSASAPPQQHAMHQTQNAYHAPVQSYSTPPEHRMVSVSSSQMPPNIPPPPPLSQSPSQSQTSRPLPEIPPTGTSPVKRRPTTASQPVPHGLPGIQPSVSYPSYGQIPAPPPLPSSSSLSPARRSPQAPAPPVSDNRRQSYHAPEQQTVPGPPPLPPRAPSAQAQTLYHNAPSRQGSGGSSGSHPLPPPPPGTQGQWQPQSAYHAMHQPPRPPSFVPPPPALPGNSTYSGQAPQVPYPGSLPMPPRLPPSQSNQQYPISNGW